MGQIFVDALTKPMWKWFAGFFMTAISVVVFFYPDLQSKLNWPALTMLLSPSRWFIVGVVLWTLATTWEATKKIYEFKKSQENTKSHSSVQSVGQRSGVTANKIEMLHYGDVYIDNRDKNNDSPKLAEIGSPIFEKIILADSWSIQYPNSKYHNVSQEEYQFTFINESGQDLKKCFILLDEMKIKSELSHGKWETRGRNAFDKPFIWNRKNISSDGKIGIEDGDRASFTLAVSTCSPVLNVTENRNDYYYDFQLTMFDDTNVFLYSGWEHRLIISFRARYGNKKNIIPVRYCLLVIPKGEQDGLKILKIERMDGREA